MREQIRRGGAHVLPVANAQGQKAPAAQQLAERCHREVLGVMYVPSCTTATPSCDDGARGGARQAVWYGVLEAIQLRAGADDASPTTLMWRPPARSACKHKGRLLEAAEYVGGALHATTC